MTIAMMAMERLNSISRPLNPDSRLSMRRALIISILIWIYSFIFSTPPVFHLFNRYVPEGYLTSCSFDYLSDELASRLFILTFFTAAWVVPLILITVSYVGIICAVRRNENAFKRTQNALNNDKGSSLYRASKRGKYSRNGPKMEMRLVKVVLSLIALWLVSWTPYAVVALLGLFDKRYITPTSSMIPALFAKLSSVINPYLYGLANPRFKRELKRKLCVICYRTKTAAERQVTLGTIATSTKTTVDPESHFVRISDGNLSEIDFSDYELKELAP